MKTNRILRVICILLLLVLTGKLAYNYNLWNIRGVEPSDLYRRYEHADGISASFIKDYRVNDTLTLEVTLLQATDSAGWQQLIEDFDVHILDTIQKEVNENRDIVTSRKIPANPSDSTDKRKYLLAISYLNKNLCIFHTQNNGQFKAVLHRNFEQGNI